MKISICIPAYKRPQKILRLLDSIAAQTFTDYEVIITDDSPDTSVSEIAAQHPLPIRYFRNETALGTPANWNAALEHARGEWIKIMHDDDWFSSQNSLQAFATETQKGKKFIFSAYTNIYDEGNAVHMHFPASHTKSLLSNPVILLARNVIGPPSVTLVHSSIKERYDSFMKWRVDIDFYIRILKKEQSFSYIGHELVNVGIGSSQVTNYCIDHPEVEIPEGALLLQKYGVSPLKNVWLYDAWWRILRNTGIRSTPQLAHHAPYSRWPPVIPRMVQHQKIIPSSLLKLGVVSKLGMMVSYLLNRKYLVD